MTKEELENQKRQIFNTFLINSNNSINLCYQVYNFAVQNNLYNTQVFMNWQDKLNEISVLYPDIKDITDIQNKQQNDNVNNDQQNQNS